jgi:hypothetical protein
MPGGYKTMNSEARLTFANHPDIMQASYHGTNIHTVLVKLHEVGHLPRKPRLFFKNSVGNFIKCHYDIPHMRPISDEPRNKNQEFGSLEAWMLSIEIGRGYLKMTPEDFFERIYICSREKQLLAYVKANFPDMLIHRQPVKVTTVSTPTPAPAPAATTSIGFSGIKDIFRSATCLHTLQKRQRRMARNISNPLTRAQFIALIDEMEEPLRSMRECIAHEYPLIAVTEESDDDNDNEKEEEEREETVITEKPQDHDKTIPAPPPLFADVSDPLSFPLLDFKDADPETRQFLINYFDMQPAQPSPPTQPTPATVY